MTEYKCEICDVSITQNVAEYSEHKYGKQACVPCQRNKLDSTTEPKLKVTSEKVETTKNNPTKKETKYTSADKIPVKLDTTVNTLPSRETSTIKPYSKFVKSKTDENYFGTLKASACKSTKKYNPRSKKIDLTYVSWADAWTTVKELYPNATYIVYENGGGMPYFADHTGGMVKVGVTINNIEHISWLHIFDASYNTVPTPNITTEYINKSVQRAFVKAIAMHGLGLNAYTGEDLPEDKK